MGGDEGVANLLNVQAAVLKASVTIAGIAIAVQGALYTVYGETLQQRLPSPVYIGIGFAAGLSLISSVKAIVDLMCGVGLRWRDFLRPSKYTALLVAAFALLVSFTWLNYMVVRSP